MTDTTSDRVRWEVKKGAGLGHDIKIRIPVHGSSLPLCTRSWTPFGLRWAERKAQRWADREQRQADSETAAPLSEGVGRAKR